MSLPIQLLAALAVLTNAVVYGTDISVALITRSVYARLDDATMTLSAGWGHYYGDLRMPPIGITGLVSALAAAILAAFGGLPVPALCAGLAVAALIAWLVLYARVAKPINTAQKAAARAGITPPDARALQNRWDSILYSRVALQTLALIALTATLATA
ncbi:DUF1772 domain-containing protein [Nocardia sp. X0981]